jgi:hypothetical protein
MDFLLIPDGPTTGTSVNATLSLSSSTWRSILESTTVSSSVNVMYGFFNSCCIGATAIHGGGGGGGNGGGCCILILRNINSSITLAIYYL